MTTALRDLCDKEPRSRELETELKYLRDALGLLNSMVRGGEEHSVHSEEAVRLAFEVLP